MSRTVLVTRPPEGCRELAAALEPQGLAVLPYPVLREADADDADGWERLAAALAGPDPPSWTVLTSARAPARFAAGARGRALTAALKLPAAAVGEATARAARAAGLEVRLVGDGGGARLARLLLPRLAPGSAVVHPCGAVTRPEPDASLEAAGHRVLRVTVYEMRTTPRDELPPVPTEVAAVVLTSPRAARRYLEAVGGRPLPVPHWAVGTTTRDAAAALGIRCRIPARPETTLLAEELCRSL